MNTEVFFSDADLAEEGAEGEIDIDGLPLEPFSTPITNLLSNDLGLRLQEKDERALERIILLISPLLHHIIARILNTEGDVADVLTNVFTEIWNRADRFDSSKGQFTGWVITIARRRAIDFLRKKKTYQAAKNRYEAIRGSDCPKSHRVFVPKFIDDDRFKRLRQVLADSNIMPVEQGQVLALCFLEGLSQRQVAAKTGVALGTIKTRYALGLQKLSAFARRDPCLAGR